MPLADLDLLAGALGLVDVGVGHLAESSATVAVVVETAIGIAEVLASIEVLLVACPPPGARARLLG